MSDTNDPIEFRIHGLDCAEASALAKSDPLPLGRNDPG